MLERKPRQLSGGQRQRVAMGRAIVREPAAFSFDEPLSIWTPSSGSEMRVEICWLQRRGSRRPASMSPHDQLESDATGRSPRGDEWRSGRTGRNTC